MRKTNFWDILWWISFGIVALYFLLKILGILKSPITIDIVTFGSALYFVGKLAQKIDHNTQKLDQTTQKIDEIAKDVEILRKECPIIKKK